METTTGLITDKTTTVQINDGASAIVTYLRNQTFYNDVDITIVSRYADIDFSINKDKLPAFIAALQAVILDS
jgi:hypothetical protein